VYHQTIIGQNSFSCEIVFLKGGDRVSLDVIKQVAECEKNAQESKLQAASNAKKTISDAEKAGLELLAETRRKAEAQVRQFMAESEAKAAKSEQDVMEETARDCAVLRQSAEKRLPEAAELIVRRVVNV